MLSVLLDFVDKHPQMEEGSLNYVVFGGSAVRVLQEDYKNLNGSYLAEPLREVSDVDLLVLKSDKRYPAHSTSLSNIFETGIKLSLDDLLQNVKGVSVRGREIVVPSRELLIVSKSTYPQDRRVKDYNDVAMVYPMGFDRENLAELYGACIYSPKLGDLPVRLLDKAMSIRSVNFEEGVKLFSTIIPRLNIASNLDNDFVNKALDAVEEYIKIDFGKDQYQIARVLQDASLVLESVPRDKRLQVLDGLLNRAEDLHYMEFDNFVQFSVLPSLKYAPSDEFKTEILRDRGILT